MGIGARVQLFLKGMAMGAADVVPGVSGGTIAFITGIYEELLASIKSVGTGDAGGASEGRHQGRMETGERGLPGHTVGGYLYERAAAGASYHVGVGTSARIDLELLLRIDRR